MNDKPGITNRRAFLNSLAAGGLALSLSASSNLAQAAPLAVQLRHVGGPDRPFQAVQAALDSISDAARDRPYLILVDPGCYDLSENLRPVVLRPYISVAGTNRQSTIFRTSDDLNFRIASYTSVSNLTIQHRCSMGDSAALFGSTGTLNSFLVDSVDVTVEGAASGFRSLGYVGLGEFRNVTIVTEGTGIEIAGGGHVYIHDCNIHLISGQTGVDHIGVIGANYCRIFVFGGKLGTGYGYPDIADPSGSVIGCLARPNATGRIHLFSVWSICRNMSKDPAISVNCVRNESRELRIRLFDSYLQSEASSLAATRTLCSVGGGKIEVYGTRYAMCGSEMIFSANQIGLQRYDASANGTTIGGNNSGPTNGGLILLDASQGPFTLYLPNPSNSIPTEQFIFKKVDRTANAVTLSAGRTTIDGSRLYRLTAPFQRLHVRFADSAYYVVG